LEIVIVSAILQRKDTSWGLEFRIPMSHENAALAVDSSSGLREISIDWYSFAQ
jgi:hypothetical protein